MGQVAPLSLLHSTCIIPGYLPMSTLCTEIVHNIQAVTYLVYAHIWQHSPVWAAAASPAPQGLSAQPPVPDLAKGSLRSPGLRPDGIEEEIKHLTSKCVTTFWVQVYTQSQQVKLHWLKAPVVNRSGNRVLLQLKQKNKISQSCVNYQNG